MDWVKGDNVQCDECEETWDGNPPCDECDKPAELDGLNLACWGLWSRLSVMDRPPGFGVIMPVPMTAIGALCEIYELTITEFERICLIENMMYGWLVEKHKIESEAQHGRVTDTNRNEGRGTQPKEIGQRLR